VFAAVGVTSATVIVDDPAWAAAKGDASTVITSSAAAERLAEKIAAIATPLKFDKIPTFVDGIDTE
jgi:ribose 5-phosphate isomerase